MKAIYNQNKTAKIGSECKCPSCGTKFIKLNYQQAFCKNKPKTQCKDKYWNTVDPKKRNNTTRISPASARWLSSKQRERDLYYDEHPFSSGGHGQWDD